MPLTKSHALGLVLKLKLEIQLGFDTGFVLSSDHERNM